MATARVWFGERAGAGEERSFGVDEEGRFLALVPAGDGVPLVVRAPGFASQWRAVSVGAGAPELVEVMQPATTLSVQVAARAVEIGRARAFVVPGEAGVTVGLAQWPFFLQALGGYEVDEGGKVTIDDLPQRGSVGVVLRHPQSALAAPTQVQLSDKPARAVVPVSFGLERLRGVVVDDAGEAIPGAAVFARTQRQRLDDPRSRRLLPPYLDLRGACATTAGAVGEFEIGLPAQDVVLSVRAEGFAGRDVAAKVAREGAIALSPWRGGDAVLRVPAPLAEAPWVLASRLGGGVERRYAAQETGALALPYAGRFDIAVRVERPGAEASTQTLWGMAVTGPTELPALR